MKSVAGAIILQLDVTPALGTRLEIDHPRLLYRLPLKALQIYERPYPVDRSIFVLDYMRIATEFVAIFC